MLKNCKQKKSFAPLEVCPYDIHSFETKKDIIAPLFYLRSREKIFKNKKFFHQRLLTGFGLVEIMVSIVILTVGIGGGIVVLNNIVGNFRLATDVFIANNLAIEGVELVRNIRDSNSVAGIVWPHGLTVGNHQVDFDDAALAPYASQPLPPSPVIGNLYMDAGNFFQHTTIPGHRTPFRRRIEIVSCPAIADCLEIRSIVTWTDIIGDQNVTVVTRLFRRW